MSKPSEGLLRRLQASEPPAIIRECGQGPLGGDVLDATEPEADEAHSALDDAEYRFDGLLAFFVEVLGILGLQLGFHRKAPKFADPPRRLWLRWGGEVVGPMRLGPSDRHQRLDPMCLQVRHCGAAGEASIGPYPRGEGQWRFHL